MFQRILVVETALRALTGSSGLVEALVRVSCSCEALVSGGGMGGHVTLTLT